MEELGSKFKEKREELGISLSQAGNDTKIRVYYLEAIEEGNFDRIGQEVYLKGFLKVYGDYLGLDQRKILQEYKEYKKIAEQESENEEDYNNKTKPKSNKSITEKMKFYFDQHQNKFLYAFLAVIMVLVIAAVLLLGTVVYNTMVANDTSLLASVQHYVEKITDNPSDTKEIIFSDLDLEEEENTTTEPNQQSETVEKKTEVQEQETDIETDNKDQINNSDNNENIAKDNNANLTDENKELQQQTNQVSENNKQQLETTTNKEENQIKSEEQIKLEIKAISNSWTLIEVDGEVVFRGTIKEGQSKKVSGKNIKLQIGNAAGIKIIKNGEEFGPFGKKGEVVVKEYSINSN